MTRVYHVVPLRPPGWSWGLRCDLVLQPLRLEVQTVKGLIPTGHMHHSKVGRPSAEKHQGARAVWCFARVEGCHLARSFAVMLERTQQRAPSKMTCAFVRKVISEGTTSCEMRKRRAYLKLWCTSIEREDLCRISLALFLANGTAA